MFKKTVIITPRNHFDPVWRRCFDKDAVYEGVTVAPYSRIEAMCIDRWIDYGQVFTESQAAVIRKYLDNHPEKLDTLKKMAADGTFAFINAGETVQDTNLPSPEGLIRNYLVSQPLYKEINPDVRSKLKLLWIEDTFGLSANYPQILKKVGAVAASNFCYKTPDKSVWEGIDGSKIAVMDRFYIIGGIRSFEKHPPCDNCLGKGCEKCDHTGMRIIPEMGFDTLYNALKGAAEADAQLIEITVGGEEILPEKELLRAVEKISADIPDVEFKVGTMLDIYELLEEKIKNALENEQSDIGEFNPVFSGCQVSRIKLKQRIRDLSYRMCAAEAKLANEKLSYPEELDVAWRKIVFCQFHDTITGTHCDSAYTEAVEMLNKAEEIISKYIDIPTEKTVKPSPENHLKNTCVKWGKNEIHFDDCGITEILCNGKDYFGKRPYGRLRREFRIGEMCLEPDFGDAWSTRMNPWFSPHDNQSLLPLGNYQKLIEANNDRIVWEGVYKDDTLGIKAPACDPMIKTLRWTTTVTRGKNDSLEFKTEVDWDTHSRRIRILFPVASSEDSALYEIPFGYLNRKYNPAQINYENWMTDSVDYPTQNWVCKKTENGGAVAIFNRGIPSFRWIPGCFEMSILRSPEALFCANEDRSYHFPDFDGLRDTGKHIFNYCLSPYNYEPDSYELSKIAFEYNMIYDFSLPFEVRGNAIVTAFKPASYSKGNVIRFYNPTDKPQDYRITFNKETNISECDMLETPTDECICSAFANGVLTPFEIKTILIK